MCRFLGKIPNSVIVQNFKMQIIFFYNIKNFSCVLRIGKKRFDYCDPEKLIRDWHSYREDDREQDFCSKLMGLNEKPIDFPPTLVFIQFILS